MILNRSRARRLLVAVVLGSALVTSTAAPGFADHKSDLKNKQKQNSKAQKDAKQDYDQSTSAYTSAVSKLHAAEKSLASARSTLVATRGDLKAATLKDAQMQAALVKSQAALADATTELATGKKDLTAATARVQQYTLSTLQDGDPGLRAFGDLLRGAEPSSFTEEMSLNDSVSDAQLADMQKLDAAKVILKVHRDKVKAARDAVAKARAEAAANLVTKKKLEAQAQSQTDQVTSLVWQRTKAKKSAASAKTQALKVLNDTEAEGNKLKAQLAALARKEVSSGGSGSGGDGGSVLSMPVKGNPPITSPYGMRLHPILHVYKLHDGTDFGVPCGTKVYAAASGTVLQEYYNYGYGNRLILNNGIMRGKNIVTTYNHLTSWVAKPGQKVKRGQLIAYSGTTGYSTGCHLHFMVLVNGATVNPMGWL